MTLSWECHPDPKLSAVAYGLSFYCRAVALFLWQNLFVSLYFSGNAGFSFYGVLFFNIQQKNLARGNNFFLFTARLYLELLALKVKP